MSKPYAVILVNEHQDSYEIYRQKEKYSLEACCPYNKASFLFDSLDEAVSFLTTDCKYTIKKIHRQQNE